MEAAPPRFIDEISRIQCVKGQTGKGKHGLTAVSSRRNEVANTLAECPPPWAGCIAIEEFFRVPALSQLTPDLTPGRS